MSPPALLLPSDDSDGAEVDAVDTRRVRRRRRCNRPWVLHLYMLMSLTSFVCYLTYSQYVLRNKFNELNETLSGLIILPSRLQVVEQDIHRLRMEFDLSRDQEVSNSTRSTTTYVYDMLQRLEAELVETKLTVHRTNAAIEDVIRRISTVEGRCLAVCQLDEMRDKQRRRQAEKKATHEIIFKRGGQ